MCLLAGICLSMNKTLLIIVLEKFEKNKPFVHQRLIGLVALNGWHAIEGVLAHAYALSSSSGGELLTPFGRDQGSASLSLDQGCQTGARQGSDMCQTRVRQRSGGIKLLHMPCLSFSAIHH